MKKLVGTELSSSMAMTIGVVTPEVGSYFFRNAVNGIEDELKAAGFTAVVMSSQGKKTTEAARMTLLVRRRVAGIIVLQGQLSNDSLNGYARHIPILATGRERELPTLLTIDAVQRSDTCLADQQLIAHANTPRHLAAQQRSLVPASACTPAYEIGKNAAFAMLGLIESRPEQFVPALSVTGLELTHPGSGLTKKAGEKQKIPTKSLPKNSTRLRPSIGFYDAELRFNETR